MEYSTVFSKGFSAGQQHIITKLKTRIFLLKNSKITRYDVGTLEMIEKYLKNFEDE